MSLKRFLALVVWAIGARLLFLLREKWELAKIDAEFNFGIIILCVLSLILVLTDKSLR